MFLIYNHIRNCKYFFRFVRRTFLHRQESRSSSWVGRFERLFDRKFWRS